MTATQTINDLDRLRDILMRLVVTPLDVTTQERLDALRLLPQHEHTLRVMGVTVANLHLYTDLLRRGIEH